MKRGTDEQLPSLFATEMGRRVFEAAAELDGDFWRASAKVWRTLTKSEQYTLGLWALVQAEKEAFRHRHPTAGGGGGQAVSEPQELGAPFSRRRDAFSGRDAMLYVVAVANSGVRKAIGELTREDIDAMVSYYAALKRSYAAKEAGWRSIAEKVPNGRTVASVEKRLSKNDMAFIFADCRVNESAASSEAGPLEAVA